MSVVKNPSKVYIGNIPRDADEGQIEKMFDEVGKCLSLEFKGDFAFVEYQDSAIAEEAIRKYDGVRIRGRRLIVEPFRYRGGDPRYRRPPPKNVTRGQFRCIVTNLSSNTTAQDLRDWVEHEKLSSVTVTDVYNRHGLNEGVVEFRDKTDWDFCIRNLDHVKLDGHYVRVYDEREYNRRKLKVYDRPPPPSRGQFRRSRSWSKGRNDNRGPPNDYNRDDRGYRGGGGGRGGGRFGGGGGGRDRYHNNHSNHSPSAPNKFDRDRNNDYRDRGRERFRSNSPSDRRGGGGGGSGGGNNNYNGPNKGDRDDRRDRGGGGGQSGYGGSGRNQNGSRSRSRSRSRDNRRDRGGGGGGSNNNYNGQNRDRDRDNHRDRDRGDRYNNRGGGGRYDRYDRR